MKSTQDKKVQKLVAKMKDILSEVSDLNNEDITDANYREFYEKAADELDRYEEDEEGESDIYKFTYNYLDDYVDLKNKLVKLLRDKSLTLEQRREFYRKNLAQERR